MLTDNVGTLSNDFFTNLLDIDTVWSPASGAEDVFEGKDRASGEAKWTGTRNDLVFGSNSILRAVAEVYGSSDGAARSLVTSPRLHQGNGRRSFRPVTSP